MTAAVTTEQLRPVLHGLGLAEPVGVSAMAGGSAPVFRVDLADGTALVLKTYPDDRPWAPGKDAYAAGLLRGIDLPVSRFLLVDESKTRLPFRFALTTWLAGRAVREWMDAPDIAGVYRQMGALLKRLHGIAMNGFGAVGAAGVIDPVATNDAFMARTVETTFRDFRKFGGDEALARRLERVVQARVALFTHSGGAVFAHDDVQQGNVLAARGADGRLRLTGLIDFGNVRAADAVYDLAKCLFCAGHEDPRAAALMREGYGAIAHPQADDALWLYTLLHRMMMWAWLRRIGAKADEGSLPGLVRDLAQMADG
jgi:aminoglycoside phosphotransferase (APT) family kinase protein